MNFIKTAGAVATGIVLSQLVKDVFGKALNGLGSLTSRTSGNDEPEAPAPKATK
tara:strand:- start:6976 stop:7137 length:162 start_codon:yes stop_codon:yes gene_type:complete